MVGVSGGADSVALIQAMVRLNSELGYKLKLHIAHLNHCLRKEESDGDAEYVRSMADSLDIPCSVEACDIPAICLQEKGSVEEVARRERYNFIERVCVTNHANYVAVAHHADDNAETVLHRILRGTGLRGVGGITPSRSIRRFSDISLTRPLLDFTKDDIVRFLDEIDVEYREDSTNAGLDATRNVIRNSIIPAVEADINPQVRDALLRLSEQARWATEYIRETVHKTYETLVISRTDQELVLNAAGLLRKGRIVQTELIREAIISFDIGEQDLSFGHLKSVTDLIADQVSRRKVALPGGMTAQLVYNRLILSLPTEQPRETIASQIAVHVPGKTVLPIRRMEIQCDTVRLTDEDRAKRLNNRDPFEEWMDVDNVHLPLVVRNRRPGDRFLASGGTRHEKDL